MKPNHLSITMIITAAALESRNHILLACGALKVSISSSFTDNLPQHSRFSIFICNSADSSHPIHSL